MDYSFDNKLKLDCLQWFCFLIHFRFLDCTLFLLFWAHVRVLQICRQQITPEASLAWVKVGWRTETSLWWPCKCSGVNFSKGSSMSSNCRTKKKQMTCRHVWMTLSTMCCCCPRLLLWCSAFFLPAWSQKAPVKGVPPKMLPPLPTVTFPFLLAFT